MSRICLWDNLKFLAILCIILLHSTMPYSMDGVSGIRYVQPFINLYPMTLFALISGFWFKEKSNKELAVLYLFPCFLFSIINNIIGIYSHFPNYLEMFSFKAGYAMWYLLALFIFSFITKYFLHKMGTNVYLLISFIAAFAIGLIPISNRYFDIQRISSLFPAFAIGVWLKEYIGWQIYENKIKIGRRIVSNVRTKCIVIFALCILFNLAFIHYYPNMMKYDRLVAYYGLNPYAAIVKWTMIFVRIIACISVIFIIPNKEYWFTKYGSRTMNAYLLHSIPIFLICWGCLYDYRYEWYGLIVCIIVIPIICALFMSDPVNKVMKKMLLSNYVKSLRQTPSKDS